MSSADFDAALDELREAIADQQRASDRIQAAAELMAGADPLRSRPLEALGSLLHALTYAPRQDDAVGALLEAAAVLLPDTLGTVCLNGDENKLSVAGAWDGKQIWVAGGEAFEPLTHIAALDSEAAMTHPLIHHGVQIGELRVWPGEGGAIAEGMLIHGRLLALIGGLALGGLFMKRRLVNRSVRDPLTGLFNRRYLEDTLGREVHRAQRGKGAVGIILLDIDGLGAFNDRHGTETGDRLLQAIGGLLQASFRGSDVCCRGAGQRFAIVLPDATLENTLARAQGLTAAIPELRLNSRGAVIAGPSASAGVAAFPDHAASPEELMAAADSALMMAKQTRRGQALVAERVE